MSRKTTIVGSTVLFLSLFAFQGCLLSWRRMCSGRSKDKSELRLAH